MMMLHLARPTAAAALTRLLPTSTSSSSLLPARDLHTTRVAHKKPHRRNQLKKMRKINPFKEAKFRYGSTFKLDPVVPLSPLAKTEHPENRFQEAEDSLLDAVRQASLGDRPILTYEDEEDPYAKEEAKCILCPRRYSVPIRPHFKNPKLLAQFVSPHTGLVYKSHITGLCASMQKEVETEVKRAQALGFMATKQKELHYLKDPPLFNASQPIKKNPY